MKKHAPVRSRLAGGALAIVLTAGLAPTAALASEPADDATPSVVDQIAERNQERVSTLLETGDITALSRIDPYDLTAQTNEDETVSLPSKFDLRAFNAVTSVKNQYPWGTCWAFATLAASESSISYELGLNNKDSDAIDLSERHLAYFARTTIDDPNSSQYGEGAEPVKSGNAAIFDDGGSFITAMGLISSGVGPVAESVAPYQNDEGLMVDADGNATTDVANAALWSTEGTWALKSNLHFLQEFELEEGNLLPSPATIDSSYTYTYNEVGTTAIKQEVMEGRAVAIGYHADWYMLSEDGTPTYFNPSTSAHYTDSVVGMNHAVTIVGWDDTYPASNFLEGHQPEGDGAWIVKNSLGAKSSSFPDNGDFSEDGYFYLSYYDQSVSSPASFDYDVSELSEGGDSSEQRLIDQYDFMITQNSAPDKLSTETESAMANVFEASQDQCVSSLSCETATADTTVTFRLYLLDDDSASPTDGVLAAEVAETYTYAGYHRTELDKGVPMREGQRYAVTVTQQLSDGTYQTCYDSAISKEGIDTMYEFGVSLYPFYGVGVVNEGESYYYTTTDGWTDWATIVAGLKKKDTENYDYEYFTYDNPAIKAYADPYEFGAGYTDVDYGAYYADSVKYTARWGLMTGYSGTTLFGVGDELTRAQLATVLWRAAEPEAAAAAQAADGAYAAANETGMGDVADNAYYTAAANWAVEAGVVNGVLNADGTRSFEPDAPATFEQFVAMLWNYSQAGAGDVATLSAFADGSEVSGWAAEAMAWAAAADIVNGYEQEGGTRALEPQKPVERERAAVVLAVAHEAGLLG